MRFVCKKLLVFIIILFTLTICSCGYHSGIADPSRGVAQMYDDGIVVAFTSHSYLDNILSSSIISDADKEILESKLKEEGRKALKTYDPYEIRLNIAMGIVDGEDVIDIYSIYSPYSYALPLRFKSHLGYSFNDLLDAYNYKYQLDFDDDIIKSWKGCSFIESLTDETTGRQIIVETDERIKSIPFLESNHELNWDHISFSDGINVFFEYNNGEVLPYYFYFETVNNQIKAYLINKDDIINMKNDNALE